MQIAVSLLLLSVFHLGINGIATGRMFRSGTITRNQLPYFAICVTLILAMRVMSIYKLYRFFLTLNTYK